VISVNTGRGKDAEWAGQLRRTAIGKRPVSGPVSVGWLAGLTPTVMSGGGYGAGHAASR
jgi:hypothetical protein